MQLLIRSHSFINKGALNSMVSSNISFKNPFKDSISVVISLEVDEVRNEPQYFNAIN